MEWCWFARISQTAPYDAPDDDQVVPTETMPQETTQFVGSAAMTGDLSVLDRRITDGAEKMALERTNLIYKFSCVSGCRQQCVSVCSIMS